MRVLVTGASGDFGRDVARRLLARGADVVAFARRPPKDPRVEPVAGDIKDLHSLTKAMQGADVVVHFAWALEPLPTEEENRAVNIGGTQNVLDAMARTGCERLIFSSSVMAYGSHADNPDFLKEDDPLRPTPRIYYAAQKAEVESMIAEAGVAATISRPAIALGHDTVSYAGRLFGMPLLAAVRGVQTRWQLIHTDDVARFHAEACFTDRTGVVNLAAPGVMSSKELAAELHRAVVTLPRRVMESALRFSWEHDLLNIEPETLDGLVWPPVVDTTRLAEEWGFTCGWSGAEAAQAAGRIFSRSMYFGARRVDAPWRMKWAPTKLAADLPPADGGELRVPAPAAQRGEFDTLIDPRYPRYRAATQSGVLPGPMSPLSLDVTLSAIRGAGTVAAEMVGLDEAALVELGARPAASFAHRLYLNVSVLRAMAAAVPGWSTSGIDGQCLGSTDFAAGPTDSSSPIATVKRVGRTVARLVPAALAVRSEAGRLRAECDGLRACLDSAADVGDERLLALLSLAWDLAVQAWLVSAFAATASGYAATVAGEGEEANLMFEQRPEALLAAGRAAAARPPTAHPPCARRSIRSRVARKMLRDREYACDVSVRATHNLRLLATERGRRMAFAGVIDSPEDAFALTFDELCSGNTVNLRTLVQARWAERDRLGGLTPPPIVEGRWEPVDIEAAGG